MYIQMNKSFSLSLNSTNTLSYSGNIYQAEYNVNLRGLLSPTDLLSNYDVTFSFISQTATTFDASSLYLLNVNFKTKQYVIENSTNSNVLGILIPYLMTGTSYRLQNGYQDNPPINISNMNIIQSISVSVTQNGASFVNLPPYVLIINFKQTG